MSRSYYLFPLISILLVIIFGCGSQTEETSIDTPPLEAAGSKFDPDNTGEVNRLYLAKAEAMAGEFQIKLKETLLTAVRKKGAAAAIKFCNIAAPEITDQAGGVGWSIRRTSDRYRNKENRADSADLAILARFFDDVAFEPYISFWSGEDTNKIFHFYEPIRVNKFCLNCHGGIQTLAPGVHNAIKRNYPDDKATGYTVGDIRGMFVVEGSWPDGLDFATPMSDTMTDTTQIHSDTTLTQTVGK